MKFIRQIDQVLNFMGFLYSNHNIIHPMIAAFIGYTKSTNLPRPGRSYTSEGVQPEFNYKK